jgi:hypothetical protein
VAGVWTGEAESDWASADREIPGACRKKIPAITTTAKRRTQALLTAES